MACKRALGEVTSSYGHFDEDEGDDSEEEEWCAPVSKSNQNQSTIFPSKRQRIDSTVLKPDQREVNSDELLKSCLGHSRTIIHIDIDCFYAQVEMIRNPQLREVPLGIQQKHIVVTCNYVARKRGLKKLEFVSDAKKKCPDLVLVNGEDLTAYREFSAKVHSLLTREFTPVVERLGMDENFLDVSDLVRSRLLDASHKQLKLCGFLYNRSENTNTLESIDPCPCGCHERLVVGSVIAAEIREAILRETGLTCCAGVSHSKLLAKLVAGWKKPNMQTTVFPEDTENLLIGLQAKDIPGIGHSMAKKLRTMNISSVPDLRLCPLPVLESGFGNALALSMIKLCHGVDDSEVIPSGEFKSISDEDSFHRCSTLQDAKSRLKGLIQGLLPRMTGDVGVPQTVRVTVRRHAADSYKKESRQCSLPRSFAFIDHEQKADTLLAVCLDLFSKAVDVQKPFHLTLLGVSLTNFHKPGKAPSKTITSFFQSKTAKSSESSMCSGNISTKGLQCHSKQLSEDIEQSSTKTELKSHQNQGTFQRTDLTGVTHMVCESKSQGLKGQEKQQEDKPSAQENEPLRYSLNPILDNPMVCPSGIDPSVFSELPREIQQELQERWNQPRRNTVHSDKGNSKKTTGIYSYFSKT